MIISCIPIHETFCIFIWNWNFDFYIIICEKYWWILCCNIQNELTDIRTSEHNTNCTSHEYYSSEEELMNELNFMYWNFGQILIAVNSEKVQTHIHMKPNFRYLFLCQLKLHVWCIFVYDVLKCSDQHLLLMQKYKNHNDNRNDDSKEERK